MDAVIFHSLVKFLVGVEGELGGEDVGWEHKSKLENTILRSQLDRSNISFA